MDHDDSSQSQPDDQTSVSSQSRLEKLWNQFLKLMKSEGDYQSNVEFPVESRPEYYFDHQPLPDDLQELQDRFSELTELRKKYQPNLKLPVEGNENEVTLGIRNGSAHVLRCLKVWYDLPSDVLFASVNIMDRFLTKMNVQPKHMACISVASFRIACKIICSKEVIPEPQDLITISQCKCTQKDLARMESIIAAKVGINVGSSEDIPVTAVIFLRIYEKMLRIYLGDFHEELIPTGNSFRTYQHLELIACDGTCANLDPICVASFLLCLMVGSSVKKLGNNMTGSLYEKMFEFDVEVVACVLESVIKIIRQYNSQRGLPHRQRLVWRLSQRTLKCLRPTTKLMSFLPTIQEQGLPVIDEREQ